MESLSPVLDLSGWRPIRAWCDARDWRLDWCWFGEQRLTRPFFHDDVEQALRLPFNLAFRRETGLTELLDWQRASPGLAPSLLVFHASRCGSTLLAQMLAGLDSHLVLSEPGPLDSLLRSHYLHEWEAGQQERAVIAMLSALAQNAGPPAQHLVVKLDAWNLFELPLIRRCFPETPWIFLYRDPLEIAASHLKMPGMQMIPGQLSPSPLNLVDEPVAPREEYIARRLGRLLALAVEACRGQGGLAVAYEELPQVLGGRLRERLRLTSGQVEQAMAVSRQNAKRPGEAFVADSRDKRNSASALLRDSVARWADAPYRELEALRRDQAG
ncbi:sulfotransferase family protein [Pseudomonas sp. PDM23]|uniref:sulfotransferase family protein n=1 Tax=unclassified Pseudomonas TaxID=196821 RepID=UPI00177DFD14|nr:MULTISPECIES: sulfotransferase family protein [unclassified Pseudomonas]MBD9578747.1 sulfotransferase family protein [Pseudomonas sp. PDM23]MBD9674071.1 sulfotransferase family protein [Pseudomonas sp. PDM21]